MRVEEARRQAQQGAHTANVKQPPANQFTGPPSKRSLSGTTAAARP
jgi:hypothetical protein